MTEPKIILNQPSIQTIELKPDPNASLSQSDVRRLFEGSPLPKFDLADIKLQSLFCKREKAQYFLQLIENWNRRMDQNQYLPINARRQFSMIEFIYSSVKRVSMMGDHQIDRQLALVYSWFVGQTKNNSNFCRAAMPRKKCENQYYNVTKTFKTNPTTIIKQYIRPKCLLGQSSKQNQLAPQGSVVLGHQLRLKSQKFGDDGLLNLLGNCKAKQDNFFQTQQRQSEQYKCLLTENSSNKIRNQQVRNYFQQKQMEQSAWDFKLKKGRLLSESTKAYLNEKTSKMARQVKTSEGSRNPRRQILKMRVQTSLGKRINFPTNCQERNTLITEVTSLGLLSNPFEVKIKLKKKKTKSKK